MKKYIIILPLCMLTLGLLTITLSKEQNQQNESTLTESNDKILTTDTYEEKDETNTNNTSDAIDNFYIQEQTSNVAEKITSETESSNKEAIENKAEKNKQTNTKNYTNDKVINITNANKEITIVDKSKGNACAQAIEYFYEDDNYKYYFTCIKSNSIYVIINNTEYKLVSALENGIITINQLEENGIYFNKTAKNLYAM